MKNLKLTKLNKTHWTINGVMSILRDDIPRSRLKASIRGATKWGNGYQDSSLLQMNNLKFCDMWDTDTVFIGPLKKSINITNLPCPYPLGPFAIINYIPDTSKLPPFIPAKEWRIDYIVYDEDKKNIKIKGFESFDNIENRLHDLKELKLTKANKTHWTINGVMTILRDDIPRERMMLSIRGAQKWGNGYQESSLFQINNINLCNYWYNDKIFMPSLRKSFNYTNLGCPYPVGTYAIVNYVPDTRTVPPYVPGKYWRFDYIIWDLDKKVSQDRIYLEFMPEKS
ncbi:uncharacterized protein LOC123290628 [Chrysoperla carnea]|uniref:uncharacterized protein LOC123290628 n=1 Tax=Chrysoperla carnea TaxID=189513 RepID=UPI001D05DD7F|nr:uncharacterized protein LOC123290628 [Chrysoperla carnea]